MQLDIDLVHSRIQVKELKQERQLVKEQNRSVINKGEPVKPLAVKTVEQPKTPAEKVQERKQPQRDKGKSAAAVETPSAKAEEKSASPSAAPETKETKASRQPGPEPAVKPSESAREKAQERKPTPPAKGKSGAAVESPREKIEEPIGKPPAGPAKPPETPAATKGGAPTAIEKAEKKEATDDKSATKADPANKGKSDELKQEKIETR